jgi:hypothetical protein
MERLNKLKDTCAPISAYEEEVTLSHLILDLNNKNIMVYPPPYKWFTPNSIPLSKAMKMVEQEAAVIRSPYSIIKLHLRKDLIKLIHRRDRYTCLYCGKPSQNIDHIVPRSKGGCTTPLNCVASCIECNLLKYTMSYEKFISTHKRHSIDFSLLSLKGVSL